MQKSDSNIYDLSLSEYLLSENQQAANLFMY